MPLPKSQQLAADVAAAVNSAFDLGAVRVYSIRAKSAALDEMAVRVASADETSAREARAVWADDVAIVVGVAKRLPSTADAADPDKLAEIDALAEQSELIRDHFESISETPLGGFVLNEITLLPVGEYEDDSGAGIFIASVRLIYRRMH